MQFQGGTKVNEVKKDTFRSEGKRVCDDDDMVRVVLDMTRREYVVYLKPLLEKAQNSDYAKCDQRDFRSGSEYKKCQDCNKHFA